MCYSFSLVGIMLYLLITRPDKSDNKIKNHEKNKDHKEI